MYSLGEKTMKKILCEFDKYMDEGNDYPCQNEAKYYSGYLGIYLCASCMGCAHAEFDGAEDLKLSEVKK